MKSNNKISVYPKHFANIKLSLVIPDKVYLKKASVIFYFHQKTQGNYVKMGNEFKLDIKFRGNFEEPQVANT